MLNRICLAILLFSFFSLFGQKEAANWYFGDKAGLTFVDGEPSPLLDGELNTLEGCAAISTKEGALLFYTNGNKVYNRNHQLMPNGTGLLGSDSSTQSAIIIPKPDSDTQYYIFTPDDFLAYDDDGNSQAGFNYSLVDMQANGGLGDVIIKNVNLLPNGSEKVTAVNNLNGEDFWVVTQYKDSFHSFKVSNSGVTQIPVVSKVGPLISKFENIRGAMKISPNGEKLAIAHTIFDPVNDSSLYLFDFDNNTGIVSNGLKLGSGKLFYGVEFSSNNSKLYASAKVLPIIDDFESIQIFQYDVETSNIPESEYSVFTQNEPDLNLAGSLQLGVDRKIYHSYLNNFLTVINNPNESQANSDVRRLSVGLGGRAAKYGLPPFVTSFFESIVDIENLCFKLTTKFTLNTNEPINNIYWDFGDPGSANNTVTTLNASHEYSALGNYTVTMVVDFQNIPDKTFFEYIEIRNVPKVNENVLLTQCDVDDVDDGRSVFKLNDAIPILLDDPTNINAIFFETEQDAIDNVNVLSPSGYSNLENNQIIYVRIFENSTCYTLAEIILRVVPLGNLETITTEICNLRNSEETSEIEISAVEQIILENQPNVQVQVYATREDALQEKNSLTGTFIVDQTIDILLFYRIENNNSCVGVGEIRFDAITPPYYEDKDVYICPDQNMVTLSLDQDFNAYEWSTGETTPSISVMESSTYSVAVKTISGCSTSAKFTVKKLEQLNNVEIEIDDFTNNNALNFITDNPSFYQYSLDEGITKKENPLFKNLIVGFYTAQVYKDNCLLFEKTILIGGAAQFFTPNGDGFHDTWQITGIEDFPNSKVFIYDRYGKLLKQMEPTGSWNGTFLGNPLPASDYWYRIELSDGRKVSGNFTLKR